MVRHFVLGFSSLVIEFLPGATLFFDLLTLKEAIAMNKKVSTQISLSISSKDPESHFPDYPKVFEAGLASPAFANVERFPLTTNTAETKNLKFSVWFGQI